MSRCLGVPCRISRGRPQCRPRCRQSRSRLRRRSGSRRGRRSLCRDLDQSRSLRRRPSPRAKQREARHLRSNPNYLRRAYRFAGCGLRGRRPRHREARKGWSVGHQSGLHRRPSPREFNLRLRSMCRSRRLRSPLSTLRPVQPCRSPRRPTMLKPVRMRGLGEARGTIRVILPSIVYRRK